MSDVFPTQHPLTLASAGAYTLRWRTAIHTNGAMDVLQPRVRELTGQQMALIGDAVIALELTKDGIHLLSTLVHHSLETALEIHGRASEILQNLIAADHAGTLPPDAMPFLV